MNKNIKRVITLAACALTVTLSACNTVEGVGKDLQAGGKGIENAADKTGDAISGKK